MSMMLPAGEAPPGLPLPPGGGGMGGPMDSLNQGPVPASGGIQGLLAALGGGGAPGGAPTDMPSDTAPGDALGPGSEDTGSLDSIGHIQVAMKHLMMALAKDQDEDRGQGITKGMGALQGILAGEQKKNAQLSQLGG